MYKAIHGVVTHIMVYVGNTKKPISLESKYSPYHEMRLDVNRTVQDLNPCGGYRIFSLPYNKWVNVSSEMHINERDINYFTRCNKWVGEGGSKTDIFVQVSNERIQLCQ